MLTDTLVPIKEKLPIIYSKYYDMTIFGLHYLHPFDTKKHSKVFNHLCENINLKENKFYTPTKASEEDLLSVHTRDYLNSLTKSRQVARIAELSALSLVPNRILQRKLLDPMRYAVGGTILGINLALDHGWAINLSGGYSHAKADTGGAYCFFADTPIAIKKILRTNPELSILIIDLDAHQGHGNATILKDDPQVKILDIYNEDIYPGDEQALKSTHYNIPVNSDITDEQYLALVEKEVKTAISDTRPNLIIYNAGTDIFEEDWLGEMKISKTGIIKRDEIVFRKAVNDKIPILMVLAGGYADMSAEIIGDSLANILKIVN